MVSHFSRQTMAKLRQQAIVLKCIGDQWLIVQNVQSSKGSQQAAQLTNVAQAQRHNFVFQHSEGVCASVHDVQLGQDTCSPLMQVVHKHMA